MLKRISIRCHAVFIGLSCISSISKHRRDVGRIGQAHGVAAKKVCSVGLRKGEEPEYRVFSLTRRDCG